jgi:tRNA/tmRNA/rRNA uracil-C5-methylase (TrmA/RlmC/RlmD family)
VETGIAGTAGRPAGAGQESLIELTVGDVAHGGWCVARQPGGRVVFVRHALPGETVRARVTDTTARFARAEAVEIVRASPDRVEPPCPHARPGGCGGCDWQHASLGAQRRLKAEVIAHQLRRIAGLERDVTVEPLAVDETGLGWRTRIRFSVTPGGVAGLLRHRSHEVVEVGECLIGHPLVSRVAVTAERWEQIAAVEVAVSPGSGERAVIVAAAGGGTAAHGPPPRGRAAAMLGGRADTVVANGPGGRLSVLRGRGYLRQSAAGRAWRAGAGTFWQVHPAAADVLATAVLEALAPQNGDVALDLYCGAGLFTGVLAEAVGPAGTVIGVEGDRAAVRDARHNLRTWPWVRIHCGDVARTLARQQDWPQASLAVLDPPRAGAGHRVIQHLLSPPGTPGTGAGGSASLLRRVAYVSCDPATLARDIAAFAEHGWKLAELRAFDAFPMTHHVECLATLVPA